MGSSFLTKYQRELPLRGGSSIITESLRLYPRSLLSSSWASLSLMIQILYWDPKGKGEACLHRTCVFMITVKSVSFFYPHWHRLGGQKSHHIMEQIRLRNVKCCSHKAFEEQDLVKKKKLIHSHCAYLMKFIESDKKHLCLFTLDWDSTSRPQKMYPAWWTNGFHQCSHSQVNIWFKGSFSSRNFLLDSQAAEQLNRLLPIPQPSNSFPAMYPQGGALLASWTFPISPIRQCQ